MLTTQEADSKLRDKLEKHSTKPGKGSSGASLAYLKAGAVALAMNEAFTPLGWDVFLDKIEILKGAHRIAPNGAEDQNGAYWNAIAYAIVTVKARALFNQTGTYEEVVRQDVAVGSAVGGKQKTAVDAIQNALTSATTNAFKRACRFFGPKTGLTLQFEPGEREAIQRALDAEKHAQEGAAEIEGTEDPASDITIPEETGQQAPAQATSPQQQPAAQTPAPTVTQAQQAKTPTNGTGGGDHGAEVLASFAPADLLARIKGLEGPDSPVSMDDVKAFHKSMAASFGAHQAIGLWTNAGVTLGAGVVVRRRDIFGVAQVIEEASAGPGGLEAFLAQFKPATPAPAQPAAQNTASMRPVQGEVSPTGTFTGTYAKPDGQAAPAATPVSPAAAPTMPSTTVSAPAAPAAPTTHGQEVAKAWDESQIGIADRRQRYSRIFGTRAPEVVEILATTPDDVELSKENAAKLHGLGLKIIQDLNAPAADVFAVWKKAGYAFTPNNGQPRGRQAREFADALPQ